MESTQEAKVARGALSCSLNFRVLDIQILLFTSSSPCREDQFAVSYFLDICTLTRAFSSRIKCQTFSVELDG